MNRKQVHATLNNSPLLLKKYFMRYRSISETANEIKMFLNQNTYRQPMRLKNTTGRLLCAVKLFLLCALLLIGEKGWGQSAGFNNTFIVISTNGGSTNTYYDLNATTANADFNNANLGSFATGSSTLVFKGAEHNVYKCGGCDLTSTRIYYRIYPTGTPSGSYVSNAIGFTSGFNNGCGGQDQLWSNTGYSTNLLSGLSAGNYTI
jgi:hypothetical protein